MKVLVVTPWLPTAGRPDIGVFIRRDIEMLRADHDVEVIHLSADGQEATVDFPVTTVRMSTADPRSIRRAGGVIAERAGDADLVHSMAASALLPFLGRRIGRPWVHTEHWSALLAPSTAPVSARVSLPLVRMLLRRPDVVIAVGHDLATAIGKTRRGRTRIIPNAVPRPVEVHARPDGGVLTLVGVGGLIARKGPDIAVRTVAELRGRGEDARLLWAGDGPMRESVASLAKELGVRDHVELRGRVSPDEVEGLLAEADVFILPTRMETFGVAIAEALVAGRPVVVSASGEQASFVSGPMACWSKDGRPPTTPMPCSASRSSTATAPRRRSRRRRRPCSIPRSGATPRVRRISRPPRRRQTRFPRTSTSSSPPTTPAGTSAARSRPS
ncbi:glycosyltransferase family 4 protein [Microbacterium sp. Se63.02b]|uniref:glycosyltransferase family 4 protein n=1 Tax=Microbacterium sp. Se63.02b TaxID=2709304 RepID=UPI0016053719|nr:glycosyltransferase family 4 protein [Microbacterium sp. Se63.02b]QNA92280.1 glycosyltransferase family 4 protein [Microbacterium sp. Se63.02b]